ncbi:DUF4785 domain-containing protein [uncultured Shewanella sp.]|uniref:DUF4785 domain-containing protein n=1 Tax=uncultured Shewanella sp. TaxID=173975 RepID=UPI00261F7356|nr:DUF4785 domain-containing protein [uncultured Shewanella sp.]
MPSFIKLTHALLLLSATLAISPIASAMDLQNHNTQDTPLVSQILTLSTPTAKDLYSNSLQINTLPAINTRRQYTSYVSKASNQKHFAPARTQTSQSDQYWKTVTGAQLNQGIDFSISQTKSIIRIAPRHETITNLNIPDRISPDDIIVTPKEKSTIKNPLDKPQSLIYSVVDADALATAGLNDNSSALTLSSEALPGQYRLQVTKKLPADGRYLINVKEKHSPFQLSLNAPIAINQHAKAIRFNLDLSQSNAKLLPQVFLQNNQGKQTPLKVSSHQDHWQAHLPDNIALSTHNAGLSEIVVNIDTQVDGLPVVRTVKTAFKAFVNSAKITDKIQIIYHNKQAQYLLLNLDIANEGRYEVSAILSGTDKSGQSQAILTTQAASWLTLDNSQLKLMLDPKLIQASGLKAPFTLSALELKDQSQMARLSYQAQALTFN